MSSFVLSGMFIAASVGYKKERGKKKRVGIQRNFKFYKPKNQGLLKVEKKII